MAEEENQEGFCEEDYLDLTPIPQDDGPTPVVPIHYTEECIRSATWTIFCAS